MKIGRLSGLMRLVLVALLVAATSIAFQGFSFPSNNNAFHVPFVLDYAGTPEGPNDAFHRSLSNFVSGFWVVVSWFANENNIKDVFFGFHFAIRFSFTFFLLMMLEQLGANRWQQGAIALLVLSGPAILRASPVGDNEMLSHYLTHSASIVPIVLASWLLAWHGRARLASAALGLGFNLNAFLAIWNACALFSWPILREVRRPRSLVSVAGGLVITFLVVALPNALWIFRVLNDTPVQIDFPEFLRTYWTGHTFVDVLLHRAIPFSAFLALGYLYLRRARAFLQASITDCMIPAYVAMCFILAAGAALPYVTSSQTALNTYPLRIDTYAILCLIVVVVAVLATRLSRQEAGAGQEVAFLVGVLLGDLLVMSLAMCHRRSSDPHAPKAGTPYLTSEFALLLVAAASLLVVGVPPSVFEFLRPADFVFAAISIAIIAGAWRRSPEMGTLVFIVTACMIANLVPLATAPPRWVFAPLVLAAILTMVNAMAARTLGAVALVVVLFWLRRSGEAEVFVAGALCLVGVASWFILSRTWTIDLLARPIALPAMTAMLACALLGVTWNRGTLDGLTQRQRDLLRAQHWIRAHTPPNTVVVVERGINLFSTMSRRPVWVDWQTGAAAMWSPAFYQQWRERYLELKRCSDTPCLLDIAKRNRVDWVVLPDQSLTLPAPDLGACVAYRNPSYAILTFAHDQCSPNPLDIGERQKSEHSLLR